MATVFDSHFHKENPFFLHYTVQKENETCRRQKGKLGRFCVPKILFIGVKYLAHTWTSLFVFYKSKHFIMKRCCLTPFPNRISGSGCLLFRRNRGFTDSRIHGFRVLTELSSTPLKRELLGQHPVKREKVCKKRGQW